MSDDTTSTGQLTPPEYLLRVRDFLQAHEPELWKWFTSEESRAEYDKAMRLDLLKATYRLDPEAHPVVHREATEAAKRLGLTVPVTLYQSQESTDLNAMLFHTPGEAHVVLTGPVLRTLDDAELRCLFGHELAHSLLWGHDSGSLLVADRVLLAMVHAANAEPAHFETHSRFRRHVEIFADRGAFVASENVDASVSMLVKLHTGLSEVSAASYIRQAEEIFSEGAATAEGVTHPEGYIRARALKLYALSEPDLESSVAAMIEGPPKLEQLDLLGQEVATKQTRKFLDHVFEPKWMRTTAMLATAHLFFEDYKPEPVDSGLLESLEFDDPALRDYFVYLLVDFLIADPELEDVPLAWFLIIAERFGAQERLAEMVHQELRVAKRVISRVKKDAQEMIAKAEVGAS